MITALRAEYRKFASTRLWWVLLLVMVAYLVSTGGALAIAFSLAGDLPFTGGRDVALVIYSVTNSIAYAFPLVIGSLIVTTELRHRTITATLLARPSRSQLIAAKLAWSVPVGLLYGLVGTTALTIVAAPALAIFGDGAYLGDAHVQQVLVFTVVAMAAWTIIGVAFGCVVTHQVAAIVGLIVFTQFIEPAVRMVTMTVVQLEGASRFFPGAAADAVVGASFFSSLGPGQSELLTRWQGALVLAAYAAAFVVAGRLATFRRDIA